MTPFSFLIIHIRSTFIRSQVYRWTLSNYKTLDLSSFVVETDCYLLTTRTKLYCVMEGTIALKVITVWSINVISCQLLSKVNRTSFSNVHLLVKENLFPHRVLKKKREQKHKCFKTVIPLLCIQSIFCRRQKNVQTFRFFRSTNSNKRRY